MLAISGESPHGPQIFPSDLQSSTEIETEVTSMQIGNFQTVEK